LNGARKPKATKAERTARDAERAAATVMKQELAMSQADGLTQMGHGGLGNLIRACAGIVNWEACLAAVTDEDITSWAAWRCRSEDSIRQFVQRGCYGKHDGAFALPIRDNDSGKVIGVHYRPDLKDRDWRNKRPTSSAIGSSSPAGKIATAFTCIPCLRLNLPRILKDRSTCRSTWRLKKVRNVSFKEQFLPWAKRRMVY
jgi:hypothetical protein